jgi:hypothetical protein
MIYRLTLHRLRAQVLPALLVICFLSASSTAAKAWGFWAHQRINRMAVFTLPPEMLLFYKKNIEYLTDHAVDPDMRRYAVEGEAPRHYIDVDHYGTYPFDNVPRKWQDAVDKFTEDSLMAYGIVPWHIYKHYFWLVEAFRAEDPARILKSSADIGHYIGDSNVPLHTTENYNGQLTGQKGIHGLWESRLVELFANDYDFYIGHSEYYTDLNMEAWKWVLESHLALDSVLKFEKLLTEKTSSDQKYSFENRNNVLVKAYSKAFCTAYHDMLAGQVERRLRNSIARVGGVWYTAWVDAGQPDLRKLLDKEIVEEKEDKEPKLKIQDREAGDVGAVLDAREMLFGSCCGHGMGDCHQRMPQLDPCMPATIPSQATEVPCVGDRH